MTVSRLYNWQNDRDAGLPIQADRMDAEFDNLVDGINSVDLSTEWVPDPTVYSGGGAAASSFTLAGADSTALYVPGRRLRLQVSGVYYYGTVKYSNYIAGSTNVFMSMDTGASLLAGVSSPPYYSPNTPNNTPVSEWIPETGSVAFASATTFTVTGKDATLTYIAGRRVKIVDTTGNRIVYGTVISSLFSTNTTVTVYMDNGASLVTTVVAVSYGIIASPASLSLPVLSKVHAVKDAVQNINAASANVSWNTVLIDALGEFSTPNFTAKIAGFYFVSVSLVFSTVSTPGWCAIILNKNGANWYQAYWDAACFSSTTDTTCSYSALMQLSASDYITVVAATSANNYVKPGSTPGVSGGYASQLTIVRIA